MNENRERLRELPGVDRLLAEPEVAAALDEFGHEAVVEAARTVLQSLREEVLRGESAELGAGAVGARVAARLEGRLALSLGSAVNATGVILHTGLGRALLPESAREAVSAAIRGYCSLAIDRETGQRGQRDSHVRELLRTLTGAEDATVVNNNAAATVLVLNTLAAGREVVVSRGQLVEIGGSFRMPEVMEASGAILREVGTTNKTHLRDYEAALGENTGAILHVHQSNYRIVGFSAEPDVAELAALGQRHGTPVIDDLGSGALVDLGAWGLRPEPLVRESLQAGAAVACFSGDKLIGGPQAGILVGKGEIIARLRKNPLARAFRVDKMTLAALQATLRLFLRPELLEERHPTYRMFSYTLEELERRAEVMVDALGERAGAEITVEPGESQIGSGSSPTETLPTRLVSVRPREDGAEALARGLRHWRPPIFGRVHQEAVLLDLRTVQPEEDAVVAEALRRLLGEEPGDGS